MKNPELLCLGCMEELEHPGDICRKCGFNRTEYEKNRNVHTLPSYTILAGKYLLGRVLGEGGFGITYMAWDLNRECRVAIKEYFPSGLATRDTRLGDSEALTIMPGEKAVHYRNGLKNFAEEGKNLARFQELPGIVSVRDFFQDNGTAYIVMDYVEGKNLNQYLREYYEKNGEHAPMEEKQILEMMRPVLQALSEIHKAGIIHRDISPENILCGSDGKITLIDFGAARVATGNETRSLTIMLKHGYAPEEQYRTRGKQGPWTDIYAICATMYQMASGYLPIESVERLYEDELQPLRKVNPVISEKFSDVVERGMAVRSEKRYQSVEQIYQALYPEPAPEPEPEPELEPEPKLSQTNIRLFREILKTQEKIRKYRCWRKGILIILAVNVVWMLFFGGIEVRRSRIYDKNFKEVALEDCLGMDYYNEENPYFLSKEKVEKLKVSMWNGDEGQLLEEAVDISGTTTGIILLDLSQLLSPEYTGTIELPKPEEIVPTLDSDRQYAFMDTSGNTIPLSDYEESEELFRSPDYFGDTYMAQDVALDDQFDSVFFNNTKYQFGLKHDVLEENGDGGYYMAQWRTGREDGGVDSISFDSRNLAVGKISDNGLIPIECNGKCGYIDQEGAVVIPLQYGAAKEFSEGLAPVQFRVQYSGDSTGSSSNSAWGYINEAGEIAIPPIFTEAAPFANGLAAVYIRCQGGTNVYGYIDLNGNLIVALDIGALGHKNFENESEIEYWRGLTDCSEHGMVAVGDAEVREDGVCGSYYILDIYGNNNQVMEPNVTLYEFSKSGLVMAVDYSDINQSWEKLQEDDYLEQQVQFCYYNDQWEKVGETIQMAYGDFKCFLDYFTDMY